MEVPPQGVGLPSISSLLPFARPLATCILQLSTKTIFLLTGLRIYTGSTKPKARRYARPKGGHIKRAAGFGFACIDTQAC